MRLLKASIENFLIIKSADVLLDAKALVLVLGYTSDGGRADSNGVGKSSIFEAICWCLYGKTYKGLSHDDVVSNRCPGGTSVSVDMVIDTAKVTVTRHRKHKKNGNKLVIIKDGKNITPFSQKDADLVLQSLLPLSYNAFKHVCYFGQGMGDKFLALNDTGRKQLLEELLGMEAYNDAEKKVRAKLRELKDTELRLNGRMETLEKSIVSQELKLRAFEEKKSESVEKLNAVRLQLATEKAKLLKTREINSRKLLKLEKLRRTITDQLEEANIERAAVNKERLQVELAAERLEAKAVTLNRSIAKVTKLSICNACEQEVDPAHTARRVELMTEEVEGLNAEAALIREKLLTYEDPIEECEELVEALSSKLATLDTTPLLIEKRRLKSELSRNEEILEELDLREEAITAPSQDLQESLQETQEELTGVESELAVVAQEKPYLAFWEKGFSTTGVRSLLLDDVITYLNSRMNHHSRAISDGEIAIQLAPQTKLKSGATREKMSVNASTGGAGYKAASGGQQRRMDLAVHFALSDLTSTVTGHRVNLLICDEVLDCIDETGTDAILSMLEEKTKKGMTVFLIDHTDAVKDNVRNVLVVSQVNGVSTAELII